MACAETMGGFVALGRLRFHYVEWGQREAPVLLVLHGLRSYAETFEELAAALAGEFRIVSLDQRGRGRTDWDPRRNYHTLAYVADLEAFVEALGLGRFHLLGHSMGGANAIVYAARHPERVASLIVEDMGPGASASSAGAERIKRELAATPGSFPDWDTARRFWRSIRPNVTDAAIDSRVRYSLKQTAGGAVSWRHDQEGIAAARLELAPIDLWPHLEAVQCPMLLVRGQQSDFLGGAVAAQMQARNPHLERIDIAGAGHYVHDDAPGPFADAVSRFLHDHRH